jgi:hypothetical protein
MANWEKLDKAFYDVINNLTDEQWHNWRQQQHQNRKIRQQQKEKEMRAHLIRLQQKEMEARAHLLKLSFDSFKGQSLFSNNSIEAINVSNNENNSFTVVNTVKGKTPLGDYALAA